MKNNMFQFSYENKIAIEFILFLFGIAGLGLCAIERLQGVSTAVADLRTDWLPATRAKADAAAHDAGDQASLHGACLASFAHTWILVSLSAMGGTSVPTEIPSVGRSDGVGRVAGAVQVFKDNMIRTDHQSPGDALQPRTWPWRDTIKPMLISYNVAFNTLLCSLMPMRLLPSYDNCRPSLRKS